MSEDTQEFFDKVGTSSFGARSSRSIRRRRDRAEEELANLAIAGGGPTRSWAQTDNSYYGVSKTHLELPPGVYRCSASPNVGPMFVEQRVKTDELMNLPDSATEEVLSEIKRFRKMKKRFTDHGFLHKRGVLLWGPPGSGKTATVMLLCDLIVREEKGVAVLVENPELAATCIGLARRLEPSRPMIAVFEDLDALVDTFGENEFLSLLDGEAQVDNIVFVATTNYPERLDKRFVDRPSRFDTIKYVGMPSPAARKTYFEARAKNIGSDVERFVAESEGFSVAHMRELVILTQCFGVPLEEAAGRLRKMRVKPASDKAPDGQVFGFGAV